MPRRRAEISFGRFENFTLGRFQPRTSGFLSLFNRTVANLAKSSIGLRPTPIEKIYISKIFKSLYNGKAVPPRTAESMDGNSYWHSSLLDLNAILSVVLLDIFFIQNGEREWSSVS